jgi:hypothetical protein
MPGCSCRSGCGPPPAPPPTLQRRAQNIISSRSRSMDHRDMRGIMSCGQRRVGGQGQGRGQGRGKREGLAPQACRVNPTP